MREDLPQNTRNTQKGEWPGSGAVAQVAADLVVVADAFHPDFAMPPEKEAAQGPAGTKFKRVQPKPANPQAAVQVRPAELLRKLLERGHDGIALNLGQPGDSCGGRFCDDDGRRGHVSGSLLQGSGNHQPRARGRIPAGWMQPPDPPPPWSGHTPVPCSRQPG